jgi:hypothetical protein
VKSWRQRASNREGRVCVLKKAKVLKEWRGVNDYRNVLFPLRIGRILN